MFENSSRSERVASSLPLRIVLCPCLCCGANSLAASGKDSFCIRCSHDDRLHVFTYIRLLTGGSQFREEGLNLAKRGENLTMGGAEGITINRASCHERSRHIPIADNHPEPRVAFSAEDFNKFGKTFGIKLAQEPLASLAEYGLAAQFKKLEV
jgi:hypothetical protein